MARRITKSVGTGITARRKTELQFDPDLPDDAAELDKALLAMNARLETTWGSNLRILDAVRTRLAEIKAQTSSLQEDMDAHDAAFRERESEGWYLHSIDIERRIADYAMAEGRPNEAVQSALLIGEYLTELRFKELWEHPAMVGLPMVESGKSRRRGEFTKHERVAEVNRLRAAGMKVGKAIASVAHQERVTVKAIEREYYDRNKINRS